jgi:GTPase SAR1 family protein
VARLICPYCYDAFAEGLIEFRCSGRPSPTGKICPRVRDPVIEARHGYTAPLPPAFKADGRKPRASCPTCRDETSYRLCPHCHSQLPVYFGRVTSRLIAMIGARESGKTVYMTVLLHELTKRAGSRFDAAVVGCDDQTRSRFTADYEQRLYGEGELFDTTRSAGTTAGYVTPLVFRFTTQRPRRFRGSTPEHSLLSFFDTAGEDLRSQATVDTHVRYLTSADGIILVLDPLQMPGARSFARQGTKLPSVSGGVHNPVDVLGRVTELLQAEQGGQGRIRKPIAVSFSKLDAFWHSFPSGTPLRRVPDDRPAFDVAESLEVDAYVRALLHQWGGAQIDQLLTHYYGRHRYFGFSALGDSPTLDNRLSGGGVRPYRVADPFLWLLSEFGTIPAMKG